ncbi:ATP-binding protein [Actinoplanes sp. DH11]|uniref:ATP-binding protein n=1 Tax=Actinoplanes sp. DH11 TaxID=2857011 RepID=UPI001E5D3C6B|nr:ATP-binding protein [Actinoplanes sp. DH11]
MTAVIDEPAARRLRVIAIGIGHFATSGDPELPDPYPALSFASPRADEVAEALIPYGYRRHILADTSAADGDLLGTAVRDGCRGLGPDDLLIVHVVGHGYLNKAGALCLLGPDGAESGTDNIDALVQRIDSDERLPRTLFLLDLCHAGSLPRAAWQIVSLDERRAWVIAACEADKKAFAGRFSQAVATVLRDVDIAPAVPYLPLPTVARAIRRALLELTAREPGLRQYVTSSLVDLADDPLDLPFFPNLRMVDAPIVQARPRVDSGVEPFVADVDEALDAGHFMTRASGYGGAAAGCFSGREDELRTLSDWFDGVDQRRLRVVTGGPGSGKSALVGVLVCAAHPKLSAATEPVWRHVQRVPRVNPGFAAVHARHRTEAETAASLVAQLELPADRPLLDRLAQHTGEPPLVAIDGVDEAEQPTELITGLLLPLATTDRADGRPLCRLLVAMRPWDEFASLLEPARAAGGLVDLDDVPAERLGRELDFYVSRLLYAFNPYGEPEYAAARATFAQVVAVTLARSEPRPPGAFLVAGMYAHHLVTAYRPIDETAKVWEIARRVPRTLEDLLELDLASRSETRWLRPVLAALAHARGEGMPAGVAAAAARALAADPTLSGPTSDEINEVLNSAGRFYLRQATDVDGTSLYRLFHQGLADHLRRQPMAVADGAEGVAGRLFAAMLAHLDPGGRGLRRWDLAEPYLLRHAAAHAAEAGAAGVLLGDPEFLVHADAGQLAGLRPLGLDECGPPGEQRRRLLAIAASVAGQDHLVPPLSRRPDGDGLPWSPAWSARGTGPAGTELAATRIALDFDGRAAVAYADGRVEVRSAATGATMRTITLSGPTESLLIGAIADRPVVVAWTEQAELWDVTDDRAAADPGAHRLGRLATADLPADDHQWRELYTRWGVRYGETQSWPRPSAPAVVHGRLVEVACTADGVALTADPAPEGIGWVLCTSVGGVPHAVRFTDEDPRELSIWNLETKTRVAVIRLPADRLGLLVHPGGDLFVRMEGAATYLRAVPPPVAAASPRATPKPAAAPPPEAARSAPKSMVQKPLPLPPDPTKERIRAVFADFAADPSVRMHLGDKPLPTGKVKADWRSFHLGLLRLPPALSELWRARMLECVPARWWTVDQSWTRLPSLGSGRTVLLPAYADMPGVVADNGVRPSPMILLPPLAKSEENRSMFVDRHRLSVIADQMLWLASVDSAALFADVGGLVPAKGSAGTFEAMLSKRVAEYNDVMPAGAGDRQVVGAVRLAEALRSIVHHPAPEPRSWWARARTVAMDFAAVAADRHASNLQVRTLAVGALYQDLRARDETNRKQDIAMPGDEGKVLDVLRPAVVASGGVVHRWGRVIYGRGDA